MTQAYELKGLTYSITTMRLNSDQMDQIQAQLERDIGQAPDFFANTPIIIDTSALDESSILDFSGLMEELRKYRLIPVGIHCRPQHSWAEDYSLARLSTAEKGKSIPASEPSHPAEPVATKTQRTASLHSSAPVRSGQQLYARDSDLIITNAVSAGAEVISDGNIHIYGALRGRALAGVSGDGNARIFCQSLEAELVSINGTYLLSEQIPESHLKKACQISLVDDRIVIQPL